MKNLIYYTSLCASCIVIVLILASTLVVLGLSQSPLGNDFAYSLGIAIAHPQLWLISIGATLLLRPIFHRLVWKDNKKHDKTKALLCIVFGFFWLAYSIGMHMYAKKAQEAAIEHYKQTKQDY
ncbi:hypothetical protein [Hoylesella nanceiensis]|uniref:hypothetical protein n=1 Tax=Hoylesella nanceiensis TaxID=425941 RepID=UPI0028EA056C|nr:hypothetical protein [Hoylesella nanceiensis]